MSKQPGCEQEAQEFITYPTQQAACARANEEDSSVCDDFPCDAESKGCGLDRAAQLFQQAFVFRLEVVFLQEMDLVVGKHECPSSCAIAKHFLERYKRLYYDALSGLLLPVLVCVPEQSSMQTR